jgi:hypothetical protein
MKQNRSKYFYLSVISLEIIGGRVCGKFVDYAPPKKIELKSLNDYPGESLYA